jgi:hypothetical protein
MFGFSAILLSYLKPNWYPKETADHFHSSSILFWAGKLLQAIKTTH